MAASAHLLPSAPSKRPDGTDRSDPTPAPGAPYRPHRLTAPHAPAVLGSRRRVLSAVPAQASAPPEPGSFTAEGTEVEPPLTSEPPLADAAPLTSEPPLADAAPLTSEPTAAGTAAGTDPSVD